MASSRVNFTFMEGIIFCNTVTKEENLNLTQFCIPVLQTELDMTSFSLVYILPSSDLDKDKRICDFIHGLWALNGTCYPRNSA
jgi:hypothetical protein